MRFAPYAPSQLSFRHPDRVGVLHEVADQVRLPRLPYMDAHVPAVEPVADQFAVKRYDQRSGVVVVEDEVLHDRVVADRVHHHADHTRLAGRIA